MNKISSFLAIAFFISAGVNATDSIDTHQQAAMVHKMMNNSDASAHQKMAQAHQAQAQAQAQAQNSQPTKTVAPSFAQMNEHEKAMVVHESMNNGHAFAHKQQAEQHRAQIPAQG
ncbi:copper-binding protein [Citrobacter tructae]|uniref:Copper-binding protein n=1 Tax=Citrobacter tructae TaxID=2562449 RepID=A0ABX5T691_9ENTR|nr:copper-binding protein [Citrobacter tructae]